MVVTGYPVNQRLLASLCPPPLGWRRSCDELSLPHLYKALLPLESSDELPYAGVVAAHSGVKATMPSFHGVSCARQPERRLIVVVPEVEGEEGSLVCPAWESTPDVGPLEV